MSKATYYIEVDTYWQNSTSYFVGPFPTRESAEAWHQQPEPQGSNVWYATSLCGGDIKTAWRIFPDARTATEAKARGMDRDLVIDPSVALSASALSDAVAELREWAGAY